MEKADLNRGDYIRVEWVDIYEDPTGDPDRPTIARRYSIGQFWAYSTLHGIQVLTTTTTEDDLTHDSGYCCYPLGCVVNIEVIKRKRKRVTSKKRKTSTSSGGGLTSDLESSRQEEDRKS